MDVQTAHEKHMRMSRRRHSKAYLRSIFNSLHGFSIVGSSSRRVWGFWLLSTRITIGLPLELTPARCPGLVAPAFASHTEDPTTRQSSTWHSFPSAKPHSHGRPLRLDGMMAAGRAQNISRKGSVDDRMGKDGANPPMRTRRILVRHLHPPRRYDD